MSRVRRFANTTAPAALDSPRTEDVAQPDVPWVTVVWNDPVNLMSYVTYVFQSYFGYSEQVATKLMLDVHEKGRAAVATGSLEEMERHTQAMHEYGLWASISKDGGA